MKCYEVAARVGNELREQLPEVTVCLVGGTTVDPNATIQDGATYLTPEADLSTIRPNGSTRDLDLVAITTDQEAIKTARAIAQLASRGDMEVAVFGLSPYKQPEGRLARASAALGTWVSRREIDKAGTVHHKLYPLEAPVPDSAFRHRLVFPNGLGEAQTFDPVYGAISYMLRSTGGLRPRDRQKVSGMVENLKARGLWLPGDEADDTADQKMYRELLRIADTITALGELPLRQALRQPLALRVKLAHWADGQDWAVNFVHKGGEELFRKLGFMR